MEMYDIKTKGEWQLILDDIYLELKMTSAITDKENAVLQVGGQRNPLCSKIRSIKEASTLICSQAQQFMASESKKKKMPIIDICDAGMSKFVIPIFYKDNFVGTITGCGVSVEGEELETFLIEKATKMNTNDIEELIQKVPRGDRSKISEITHRLFHQIHN